MTNINVDLEKIKTIISYLCRDCTGWRASLDSNPDLLSNRAMFVSCLTLVSPSVSHNSTGYVVFYTSQLVIQVIHFVDSEAVRGRERACKNWTESVLKNTNTITLDWSAKPLNSVRKYGYDMKRQGKNKLRQVLLYVFENPAVESRPRLFEGWIIRDGGAIPQFFRKLILN